MIKGGYIILPRLFDRLLGRPPLERELYLYLLRNVNYKDTDLCKRGSGFFQLSQIAEDLSWRVGYRRCMYDRKAISKALQRLCEGDNEGAMTATTKATRGLLVTVCDYDLYQTPSNYEGDNEGATKATTKVDTIQKKEKKERTVTTVTGSDDTTTVLDLNRGIVKGDGWRNSFEQYKSDLRQIYIALINDPAWMAERQRLNPGVDVTKTLEKACIEFWATEDGWAHKKKNTKRGSYINWKTTLAKTVSFKPNRVYEQRNGTSRNGDSSAARGISNEYKAKILRDLGFTGGE